MAEHLIYHWKHGWIPLTHAAALSKAHGSAKLADKYVPGASSHHASRATAGKSAREIHAALEPHQVAALKPGDHATVHGMDEYGQPITFTGHVQGVPTPVKIKRGRTGVPESHYAVAMAAGPAGDKGMGHARSTVYVKSSVDAHALEAHRYTPEKGAAAAAELQAAHDGSLRAQAEELRRLEAERKKLKAQQRRREAQQRRRETPEEVAKRIGMEFVTPTVKSHGLVGPGATVERPASDARRVQVGITQGGFRAHGLNPEGRPKQSANGYTEGDRVERKTYDFTKPGHPETWQRGTVEKIEPRGKLAELTIRHDDGSAAVELIGPRSGNAKVRKVAAGQESGVRADSRAVAAQQAAHDRIQAARQFGAAANAGQRANITQAQAQARADALRKVKPVQAEMFGAHGEQQPDMFEQAAERPSVAPTSAEANARARVAHSGDGTLLSIDRNDEEARAAAKAAGFRWSSNLQSWFLPRSWSEPTRRQKIEQLRGKLGTDAVHVKDEGRGATTTAAEREAAARAHAADRAGRMDARAAKHSAEADARFGAARQIGDLIPMGQPILVGHHSERRHRKDLERIDSNMRKGSEAYGAAKAAENAAANARRTAAGDSPLLRQRRIDRNEAELRKIERQLKEHDLAVKIQGSDKYASSSSAVRGAIDRMRITDDYHAQLSARRAELVDQIAHDRGQIAASGHTAPTAAEISPGDIVQHRGRAHIVKKVNQKTVSVPTGYSWDDKLPVNQITKHIKVGAMSDAAIRAGAGNKTLDPKVRAVYERELKRRGLTL